MLESFMGIFESNGPFSVLACYCEGDGPLTITSNDAEQKPFSIAAPFNTAAQWTSRQCGRAPTFAFGLVVIILAVTGPFFNYSDTWQLGRQHGHDYQVAFLMVFLIQNTQKTAG